jgi:hypothetical protein
MKNNIRLELERGGKLDDMESKSGKKKLEENNKISISMNIDMLNEHARQFQVHSTKIKRKYWWKNVKVKSLLVNKFIFSLTNIYRCGFVLLLLLPSLLVSSSVST